MQWSTDQNKNKKVFLTRFKNISLIDMVFQTIITSDGYRIRRKYNNQIISYRLFLL
jgi:hypothetical protein